MIKAGSLTKGIYLNWKDKPVVVIDKGFSHLGRGSAIVRLKIKEIKTGAITQEAFKSDDLVEEINLQRRSAQFLYQAGDQLVFINPKTYEQIKVEAKIVGDDWRLLKEGSACQLLFYQDKAIGVHLPKKVALKVVETEAAVKGNTVSGATKLAKTETGLVVKVPLFIKKGEVILVSTETKEYLSRQS